MLWKRSALYLDHGFLKTQHAVLGMLKHYGLDEQVNETHDFKSKLHQWATKRRKKLAFEVLRDDDTAGEERYEIAAKVNGEVYGIGIGRSKKLAEQEAARRAWKKVYDRRGARGQDRPAGSTEGEAPSRSSNRRRSFRDGAAEAIVPSPNPKGDPCCTRWSRTVPDYELLGISSSVGCHRLAWAMNRAFDWQLKADADVVVDQGKAKTSLHPSMRFVNEDVGVAITVVLNRVPEAS